MSNNKELTDLTALYLSEVLKRTDFADSHITEITLSNTKMQNKAGIFIGEVLMRNPTYPIERIKFKDVNIEETGIFRILEAINLNQNIKKVHLGIVSDFGLKTMADLLKSNKSLTKLEF